MDLMKQATDDVKRYKQLFRFAESAVGRSFAAEVFFGNGLSQGGAFVLLAGLTSFGREILFFLHPFLEPTLKNSPLSANFEGGNLAVLNHAMQRSLRNFQNSRRLS